MRTLFSGAWTDDEGQDLVEYALLLVFIALVVAAVLPAFAAAVQAYYGTLAAAL